MSGSSGIHFEMSERKILLRLLDLILVVSGLYFVSSFFELDYFLITPNNWAWTLVLIFYLTVFGSVFELYHLKEASKIDVTFKNIIFTTSLTVLIYLLTPVVTPSLPQQRIHIVYFYITIMSVLFLWRLAYITLIDTPRFYKRGIIIGEISNIDTILKTLHSFNPNYKIVGYINNENNEKETIKFKGLEEYRINDLQNVIQLEGVSEIIVAIDNPETITPDVYHQLTDLLEKGFKIKEYTQVIEDLTQRVPVQFVGKDFYRYFPFSRSNQNKLYLFSID